MGFTKGCHFLSLPSENKQTNIVSPSPNKTHSAMWTKPPPEVSCVSGFSGENTDSVAESDQANPTKMV